MRTAAMVGVVLAIHGLAGAVGGAAEGRGVGRSDALALLKGSWEATIYPYNCTTGAEAPAQFWNFSYLTFGRGGTLLETTSIPRFLPGMRSAGHGQWERTGRTSNEAVLQAFIQFDTNPPATPPNPTYVHGSQRIEQVIEMVDDDRCTSVAEIRFRKEDGTPASSGCAKAEAVRMPKVLP